MLAQGYTQADITRELKLERSTVYKDMAFLREESKEHIKDYVISVLPLQFRLLLKALQTSMQMKPAMKCRTIGNQKAREKTY